MYTYSNLVGYNILTYISQIPFAVNKKFLKTFDTRKDIMRNVDTGLSLAKFIFGTALLSICGCICANSDPVEPTLSHEGPARNNIPTMEVAIRSQKVFRFAFNPNR